MAGLLENRIAFVTGGAGGIGAATAIAFAAEGAKVAVADLKDPNETVETIIAAGGEAYSIALDVTDQAAVEATVDGVVAKWGRLDIAFNNAGVSLEDYTTPWESVELYDKVVAVNQRGVMLCMAAELRHMAKQGSGSIVNTASVAGMVGLAGAGYCGSKHAVVGLTRSAAMRYAAEGIRVNCVCPGAISTPMTEAEGLSDQSRAFMAQMHPMNRMGRAEEIADAVVFLSSDKASFITGHPLAVDGGYLAR
ncbi:MAG: SDR family oxidoreductase [Rhizorhabdus sp.]|jgi:NAD(P)-dependent dehydrogenase (short-subunit alcohol dehydrogenase family)|uniref:SDR family oxidoreductase n=2 Tax=Rhizorhabdus sp. TaxID=1968843 RepID=UPI001B611361|nr:SDR family oxidoreductase [Rhizorhabdus sp.]MBP8231413.1 SDR family oxidoreductase [Rhizorhabdus sp.]